MRRYFSYIFLTAMLVVVSCENETDNAPIIKGMINGNVTAKDAYGYNVEDLSNVQIHISSANFSADTITDADGNFLFKDVPFGRYYLTCTKEGFIQRHVVPSENIDGEVAFGHIGGEIATSISEELLGVPDFGYQVDSLVRNQCYLNCYLELTGPSKTPEGMSHFIIMYFADTPDVDAENYDKYAVDVNYLPSGIAWNMALSTCYGLVLSSFTSDTVYCRIYPIPFCYLSTDDAYLTLPKGKPSNVFAIPNNL